MTLRAVVAIPAKDEAQRIGPCLAALARQCQSSNAPVRPGTFGVVLLLNNCRDDTATIAREHAGRLPYALRTIERDLPPEQAHAGWARKSAMDLAADWLDAEKSDGGILLTTDGDSCVAPNWLSANIEAIDRGVDGVAGCIVLDPDEDRLLPEAVHCRGRLEGEYETLLAELRARLDPQPHDPWPNHATTSGASLAVTLRAYRRIGGLPALPLGEDKALIAALLAHDARVRHDLAVKVVTSGRLDGRAVGGVADTLRLRSLQPNSYCDEVLEPLEGAIRRAVWRRRLRRLYGNGRLGDIGTWAARLGVHPMTAAFIADTRYFGAAWGLIEKTSGILRRERVRPSELSLQIRRARLALRMLSAPKRAHVSADPVETFSLAPASQYA